MSDKPAVISGVYVDCKFMPGLKSARIAIDIPIEHSNEFLRMFGAPDRASPVAVAIARLDVAALNAPTVPEKAVEPAKVEKAETKRSSRAYLMLRDAAFRSWLAHHVPGLWDDACGSRPGDEVEAADLTLKWMLNISSKTKLDADPEAAARFDALRTDFELRDLVRT